MISIFFLNFLYDIDDGLILFICLLFYDLDWDRVYKKGRMLCVIIDEIVVDVLYEIIN